MVPAAGLEVVGFQSNAPILSIDESIFERDRTGLEILFEPNVPCALGYVAVCPKRIIAANNGKHSLGSRCERWDFAYMDGRQWCLLAKESVIF